MRDWKVLGHVEEKGEGEAVAAQRKAQKYEIEHKKRIEGEGEKGWKLWETEAPTSDRCGTREAMKK